MIILTGKTLTLTLEEVECVVFRGEHVTLSKETIYQVEANRASVEHLLAERKTMYGINTGFGKFSDVVIGDVDLDVLQLNLIHSHAYGIGNPFSEKISRVMLLLRANALVQGYSGVRPQLVNQLIAFVNKGIHPVIPQQGSLGASGDLAPLSHLALALLGEGEVFFRGERMPTADVLAEVGLPPLILKAKEGLALINGTQAMTAVGVMTYLEMEKLLHQCEHTAAMTLEGLQGIMQYSAASLVSENKTLAHPASVDSIPSSANQEDHVSMGMIAARHALQMLTNTRYVVAIELICARLSHDGPGGMDSRTLLNGILQAAEHESVVAIDIVEVDLTIDFCNMTSRVAAYEVYESKRAVRK